MQNISSDWIGLDFHQSKAKPWFMATSARLEFSNVCLLIVDLGQNYGMLRLNPIRNAQFCPCRKMDSAHS